MATRITPRMLGVTITPTGIGAVLHLYAGLDATTAVGLTVALTVPALVATVVAALIAHLPAIVRERSKAQTREAVINQKITATDAALLLGEDAYPPAALSDEAREKPGHSRAGSKKG